MISISAQVLIIALTGHVDTSSYLSGYPTRQEFGTAREAVLACIPSMLNARPMLAR